MEPIKHLAKKKGWGQGTLGSGGCLCTALTALEGGFSVCLPVGWMGPGGLLSRVFTTKEVELEKTLRRAPHRGCPLSHCTGSGRNKDHGPRGSLAGEGTLSAQSWSPIYMKVSERQVWWKPKGT